MMDYMRIVFHAILIGCFANCFSSFQPEKNTTTFKIPGLVIDSDELIAQDNADIQFLNAIKENNNASEKLVELRSLQDYGEDSYSLMFITSDIEFHEYQANSSFKVTLNYKCQRSKVLSFSGRSEFVGSVINPSFYELPPTEGKTLSRTFDVPLEIKYLGKMYVYFWIRNSSQSLFDPRDYWTSVSRTDDQSPVFGIKVIVSRIDGPLQLAFRVLVISLAVILTFTIGCDLDIKIIIEILKKPIGPIIGFLCQYSIMPIAAFILGYFIPISREFAFGLLVVGCCPGGGPSNAWTYLLDGDINLSMTMTFLSSLTSIGILPLLLFIFGRYFIDSSRVRIPYLSIVGQLLLFIVPVTLSIILRWRKPKIADKIAKTSKYFALGFIIFILTFGTWANFSLLRQIGFYPILIPIGAFHPWIGLLLGSITAWILCQPKKRIIAIGIETAIQNHGIAFGILLISMPRPDGELGAVMVYIIALLTPIPLYTALIVKKISNLCKRKNQKKFDTAYLEKE